MKFASQQWLWALLFIPALYAALVQDGKRRRAQFARFADSSLWKVIAPEIDWGARLRKGRLWMIALALIFVALARPQWGEHEESVTVSGMDIMVVLDVSSSMEVEDVVPSRAKKARHVVRSIADRLQGDRVGLIAFAGSSFVVSPLTTDVGYLYESLEILGPRIVSSQGTDVGGALETAARALERGAENPEGGKGVVSRAVILISDGEDHEEHAVEGARKLAESGVRLYALGIGTSKGGPIPVRDERGQLHGYKRDRSGASIVSTFRPDALMSVAAAAEGRYWTVTPGEAEVDEMLADLGALARGELAERRFVVREDRFQWPLLLAVLLLFLELGLPARLLQARAAMPLVAALLLGLSTSAPVFAAELRPAVPLQSYLKNQQGIELYEQGKVDEAQQRFGEAQALDPSLPALQFNQGAVHLKKGETDAAAREFEGSAMAALQENDAKLAGQSYFNLGVTLAEKGDSEGAVRAYRKSLLTALTSGDRELEAETRKNLELLAEKVKQQKQKQKQKQQEQGEGKPRDEQGGGQKDDPQAKQGGSENGKQDSGGKDKDPSQQGQGGNEERKYKDLSGNRQREFKSQKLSKEDADRVMAELANKERDVQARLKKQKGAAQAPGKDW